MRYPYSIHRYWKIAPHCLQFYNLARAFNLSNFKHSFPRMFQICQRLVIVNQPDTFLFLFFVRLLCIAYLLCFILSLCGRERKSRWWKLRHKIDKNTRITIALWFNLAYSSSPYILDRKTETRNIAYLENYS